MTTPPIIPGPPQPEPWQPQPVYQQPYAPPQQLQPGEPAQVVKKAAIGTVTVIVTLVLVLCVLPAIACGLMAALGSMSAPRP